MAKIALLIGVSEYEAGLNPLPGAVKDIEAMERVLHHAEMGGFDRVNTLPNPDPMAMQEAIETLFSDRAKDDLVLLFFSGHGVKDDSGRLYFATRATRKNPRGELVKATAVPAGFVQDVMSSSRCKRQVVILDCCFSGAFAEGMTAKDDGTVDVQTQLGGEGRAVLTSSTSTQYSFEQQGSDLSVYTQYIVEGIETGAADTDRNGAISIDELHEYAQKKVQEAAPAMKPKIYAVEEGFKIRLAQAPTNDLKLQYRREVEQCASRGKISEISRYTLDARRDEWGLSAEEAIAIEAEVLKPYQERQRKLQQYDQVLQQAIQHSQPLSDADQADLKHLQKALELRDEDIAPLLAKIPQLQKNSAPVESGQLAEANASLQAASPNPAAIPTKRVIWVGGALVLLLGLGFFLSRISQPPTTSPAANPAANPAAQMTSFDLYQKAVNQQNKQDLQGAIATYNQALQIDSNWGESKPEIGYYGSATAFFNLGNAHFSLGNQQKAVEAYSQAIADKADYADAYANRGRSLALLGKKQEAIVDFGEAANFYAKQGRPQEQQKALDTINQLAQ
ncbi:MAG TPA: caspase family protein [Coleofasciculaceae cyanobacterium]